jgi:toxin CcdB
VLGALAEILMPQFAVYRNNDARTWDVFPWLVDVQADLFQDLDTRVVIPLTAAAELIEFPLAYLTPTLMFDGQNYVLMTPQLAGVTRADLGPHAGSVADQQRTIETALDFLLRGF